MLYEEQLLKHTTTRGKPVSVLTPNSSVGWGWLSGGEQTSWVDASEVTLQTNVPIVTFTSDSSLAKFKFSPYRKK